MRQNAHSLMPITASTSMIPSSDDVITSSPNQAQLVKNAMRDLIADFLNSGNFKEGLFKSFRETISKEGCNILSNQKTAVPNMPISNLNSKIQNSSNSSSDSSNSMISSRIDRLEKSLMDVSLQMQDISCTMSSVNFDYIWDFLQDNKVEPENKRVDLTCGICKRTLIDPRVGSCGCRYCLVCVQEYLIEENRHCPGSNEKCQVKLLDNDILSRYDNTLNLEITKLIMKCPRDSCDFRGELGMMENHVKSAHQDNFASLEHLIDINEKVGNLSLKHVYVLKNMVTDMTKDFLDLKDEMREMRAIREHQKKMREKQDKEIEQLELEMEAIKQENKEIQEERNHLQLELERNREEFLELMTAIQQQITEMRARDKTKHEKMNNWEKGID